MFRDMIGKVYFSDQGASETVRERSTYMHFINLLYDVEGMYI